MTPNDMLHRDEGILRKQLHFPFHQSRKTKQNIRYGLATGP
jgi:hypothetical protein